MANTKKTERRSKRVQQGAVIFVVEDDEIVRMLMRKLLESDGYRVLEACDGATARATWKRNAEGIDLVIVDMLLPDGVTGTVLATEFQRDKSSLNVIVASGYGLGDLEAGFVSNASSTKFIQKPFDPETFLELVGDSVERK